MPSLKRKPLAVVSPDTGSDGTGLPSQHTQGKQYWRSLDRLLDSATVRDAVSASADGRGWDELPGGASEPPDAVNRRTMLTLMGASFTLAGLTGCRRPVEKIVPYVSAPEYLVPGIPEHYATTVTRGSSAYGVVVESHEGRPTKIEGNELHPSSLGAADTWMQASVLNLCDPDRSSSVRRRATGEESHRPSAWRFYDAFLAERLPELEASGGEGLAVLSGAHCSPSLTRLAAEFADRFPRAKWVAHEPLGDGNVFAGCEMATGTACRPVYHFERARKIVSLDADFLHTASDSLTAARGFARGRKINGPEDEMNRLYVVESALSTTGGAADHRVRLQSREIGAFAAALAAELGFEGASAGAPLGEAAANRARLIAADLQASPGEAVVIAGRGQPPEVHALALAINQALGAIGNTVTLHDLADAGYGSAVDLAGLVEAMNGDAVDTLVILGGNPVYDAPADLGFADALAKVKHSIHLSSYFDETSLAVHWHLPEAHFLEVWGDARAADGSLSAVQPLIAPLLEGKSALEVVAQLVYGEPRSGYDVVRETWLGVLGGESFERDWRRVLHDGVLAASASAPLEVSIVAAPRLPAPATGGHEITFQPSLTAFDGRYANNGWLQELPDAITKITWDNAALLSPATAEQFDLASGDLVSLGYRDRTLDVPVFVLPGQADDSVALALGYGRTAAGRVGDGVGVSGYLLRDSAAPDFDGGLSLTKVKGSHMLAQTQEHWDMEGRELIREASLEEYRAQPGFVGEKPDPDKSHQLFPPHSYEEGYQWGMAIDLSSCIGCNACVVACQSENNIPIVGKEQVSRGREMHWLRIDRYFSGASEDPEVAFQPVACMHCENAPCEQVCPVAATVHDDEGLNAMVYNRCIGTRYCSNNCPYKVRRFNFFNYTKDTPELAKMAMNPDVTVRSRGVMEKCSYCVQRISEAKIVAKRDGRRPVRDGEIKTACQQTCPTEAIVFGNVRDPDSEVSHWKQQDRDYVVLGELNNRTRTSYLARLRNPNPEWETA
ncbi:MAG: 4Fe-4S dicluster domain-containing protein [bacterium]|nr:4Fe-4S dicluster domain-containing protein [bacterium]